MFGAIDLQQERALQDWNDYIHREFNTPRNCFGQSCVRCESNREVKRWIIEMSPLVDIESTITYAVWFHPPGWRKDIERIQKSLDRRWFDEDAWTYSYKPWGVEGWYQLRAGTITSSQVGTIGVSNYATDFNSLYPSLMYSENTMIGYANMVGEINKLALAYFSGVDAYATQQAMECVIRRGICGKCISGRVGIINPYVSPNMYGVSTYNTNTYNTGISSTTPMVAIGYCELSSHKSAAKSTQNIGVNNMKKISQGYSKTH